MLIALHHHTSARVLLTGEWIAALCGAVFAACSDLNAPSTTMVELSIFICMGFGLFSVWPAVVASLTTTALNLLILGGAAYVFGIVFFILGEYKPIYHVIWHLFVVLGAVLHWFDVYFFIVPTVLHADGTIPPGSTSILPNLFSRPEYCNCTRS
jgi:channel protein (hemolysin III family)